jgi:hypothetical protein
MAMLPKIIAIAGGTGWATLAQIAGADTFANQPVHIYGGWGVAVMGLILLWKDNKALREEARLDRLRFDAERSAREVISDVKDEKHLKFTQECTNELRQLRQMHSIRCLAQPQIMPRPASMED